MVHHMTDAVSKQQFLAADKTCSCETTTIPYRVENKKGNFRWTFHFTIIKIQCFWTSHGHGLVDTLTFMRVLISLTIY